MMDEQFARKCAKTLMLRDEVPGEHIGNSGHLSEVSCKLDHVEWVKANDGAFSLTYYYTLSVCTEFTISPENPPYAYRYKKKVLITIKGDVLEEGYRESYKLDELPPEVAWPMVQSEILLNLEAFLWYIETKSGELRASVTLPPVFLIKSGENEMSYICMLKLNEEEEVILSSEKPAEICGKLNEFLKLRFNYESFKPCDLPL